MISRSLLLAACAVGVLAVLPAQAQRSALRLQGQGYATASNDAALDLNSSRAMTLEVWVKHDGNSAEDAVIVTNNQNQASNGYELRFEGAGEEVPVVFTVFDTFSPVQSRTGIAAGVWTHVAGVYTGTQVALYINGVLDNSEAVSGNPQIESNGVPLRIGADETGGAQFFSGQIDDLRIWSVSRSLIEIRSTIFQTITGTPTGLVAQYGFDGNADDRIGTANLTLAGDAALAAPGLYPVPPQLFGTPGNASVQLTWNHLLKTVLGTVLPNPLPAAQFKLYRSTQADRSDRQLVSTFPITTTTFTDAGLSNGTVYFYELTAVDAGGNESDFSAALIARPFNTLGGGALSFDGPGQATIADRPSLDLEGSQAMTVEMWVRHDGTSEADAILIKDNQGEASNGYELRLVGAGEEVPVVFRVYDTFNEIESKTGLAAGVWTHVAGVYTGTQLALYINGVLDNSDQVSNTPAIEGNDVATVIGSNLEGNAQFFSGAIDEIRIWGDARTTTEIASNRYRELVGNEADLVGYWRFDEVGAAGGARGSLVDHATVALLGATVAAEGALPTAPDLFAIPGDTQVRLAWEQRIGPNSANQASQFKLYRSTDANGSGRQLIATIGGSSDSFTDAGLTNGTSLFYEMTAVDAAGRESFYGTATVATPSDDPGGFALQLDGSGDHALISSRPSLDMEGNQALSVEMWIKHDGGSEADAILIKDNQGEASNGYELRFEGTSEEEAQVLFRVYDTFNEVLSNARIAAGVWTHVAAVYSGTQLALYINGVLDNSVSVSNTPAIEGNEVATVIGSNLEGNAQSFSGQIDEVRIWSDARTATEIAQNRTRAITGNEANLVGYFRFDETEGGEASSSGRITMTAVLMDNATFSGSAGTPLPTEGGAQLPERFTLEGSYPNPFNPQATIRYGLAQAASVRVTVYDATGRQIAVLVNGAQQPAGWHEVVFEGTGLPSGLYLYRVEADGFSDVGRMMLVK